MVTVPAWHCEQVTDGARVSLWHGTQPWSAWMVNTFWTWQALLTHAPVDAVWTAVLSEWTVAVEWHVAHATEGVRPVTWQRVHAVCIAETSVRWQRDPTQPSEGATCDTVAVAWKEPET